MPTGVYKRTEAHKEIARRNVKKARSVPRTKTQYDSSCKNFQKAREIAHKLPRTQNQIEASRRNVKKCCVFADTIVKHHNDLQHGALRPNDVTYMTHSAHMSLHMKLRVDNGANLKKLTKDNICEIKSLIKVGLTQTEIAKQFNVCQSNISYIHCNKTWKEIN